jgi:hypothetical protein
MSTRQRPQRAHLRTHIAQAAAKLIIEGGIQDYALAKRKAAHRLQATDAGQLPGNNEIEQEINAYQRLFRSSHHLLRLKELRWTAIRAMRFLTQFSPYLVGPVLRGSADKYSHVNLHLFAEPSEEVALFLFESGIPHESGERRLRVSTESFKMYPTYTFVADDVPVELVVFPHRARKHAPVCPVEGKPMRRANTASVESLVAHCKE